MYILLNGIETIINIIFTLLRDNPTKAELQTMDKKCLPMFTYFRPQRKSKVLVHGFGDSAEDSLMFPLLRDGMYLCIHNTY